MKYVRAIFLLYLIKMTVSHLEEEVVYKPYVDVLELAQKDGFNGDRHVIRSEDSHDTELFRIESNSYVLKNREKPVILIERSYIGPENEDTQYFDSHLAYFLANRGYDVWLGTYRNDTDIQQSTLEKKNSFITVGATDVIAAIKYILVATKQKTITLIGQFIDSDLYYLRSLIIQSKYQEMVKLIVYVSHSIDSKTTGWTRYKINKLLRNQQVYSQDKISQINQNPSVLYIA